jgi:hypothetical protein
MTSNEFFRGLLAALAVEQRNTLQADHARIHHAFNDVLQEIQKPEIERELDIEDSADIDYDPLYGQSAWFDRALTRAQRDHIISFPNPSYNTINIKYDQDAGTALLQRLGPSQTMKRLADVFFSSVETRRQE